MDSTVRYKKGFGLLEALASMFILALLATAVMVMNYTNHQAALRIATRNEATTIGHRVLDSLQTLGISRVQSGSGSVVGDSTKTVGKSFDRVYHWRATVTTITSTVGPAGLEVISDRAKKVDLEVKWKLGVHENLISLSTVVE
jgi:Tfp pilus assembly protein PilV